MYSGFTDIEIDGQERTAIKLIVEPTLKDILVVLYEIIVFFDFRDDGISHLCRLFVVCFSESQNFVTQNIIMFCVERSSLAKARFSERKAPCCRLEFLFLLIIIGVMK